MNIIEKCIPFKNYKTYVKIANPEGKNTPLILLHGGPGSTHNSLELLIPLAEKDNRPLFFYDQIGCGLSSRDDDHPEIYTKELWIEELENLLSYFNITSYHLLGHSWGGMLAQLFYLSKKREGVRSLILSSTLSSASLWKEETHRIIKTMGEEDQKIIANAEKENNYTSPAFLKTLDTYMRLTVSDYDIKDPSLPECLRRKKNRGDVAYLSAWGPSEFSPQGTLKDYETTSRLKDIYVPTLIMYGEKDESTKKQNELMFNSISSAKKKLVCFQNARHMTYFEKNNEYIEELSSFLKDND